jgi:hypothetical protein
LCRVIVAPSRGIGWLAQLPPGDGEIIGPPGVTVALGAGPGAAGLEPWRPGLGLAALGLSGPAPAWGVAACEPHPAAASSTAASRAARDTGLVSMPYLRPGAGRGVGPGHPLSATDWTPPGGLRFRGRLAWADRERPRRRVER